MPSTLADTLHERRRRGLASLVPYLLVDARRLERFRGLARACAEAGAVALELGVPFTDPIADGPTLESASQRALNSGTRWSTLLDALRAASEELPCAVMTYANPLYAHGLGEAFSDVASAGASAVIVPDLGFEEAGAWRSEARRHGLSLTLLAAPGGSPARVRRIARTTDGFLYLVSRFGVTGAEGAPSAADVTRIARVAHRARPELPVLLGFGIRGPDDVRRALGCGADGVIVGSALESALERSATPRAVRRVLSPISRALGARPDGPDRRIASADRV